MGFSSSDVSSYVARDLFYSAFPKTNSMMFMASSFQYIIDDANSLASRFKGQGYNSTTSTSLQIAPTFNSSLWLNRDLIDYMDHGNWNWAGIAIRNPTKG